MFNSKSKYLKNTFIILSKGSAFDLDAETFVEEGLDEAGHLVDGEFLETLCGGGSVDGVNHYFAGTEEAHYTHPAVEDFGACGVEAVLCAAEHHGLEDEVAVKLLEGFDGAIDVVTWGGLVDARGEVVGGGVDFHDGVVDLGKGLKDGGDVDAGGVGEDGHFGRGGIKVAQGQGVVDDLRKFGVEGGFAITREGEGVDLCAFVLEAEEHTLEVGVHFDGGGYHSVIAAILVPATFTIDAVEVAYFAFFGHEVDAKGGAETTAENRTENSFFTNHSRGKSDDRIAKTDGIGVVVGR